LACGYRSLQVSRPLGIEITPVYIGIAGVVQQGRNSSSEEFLIGSV
jgi:hypothetical protein